MHKSQFHKIDPYDWFCGHKYYVKYIAYRFNFSICYAFVSTIFKLNSVMM